MYAGQQGAQKMGERSLASSDGKKWAQMRKEKAAQLGWLSG